ncbi:MAG: hypothetical protein ISR57_08730, partial [Bacteroidales bacterium]|nr:hypothetical protein [Bacteroidales bacterium]
GFGIYIKRFFVDVAYQWSRSESNLYLYDPTMVNAARITTLTHIATGTFGFRF